MRGSLSEATLQMDAIHCISTALCVRTYATANLAMCGAVSNPHRGLITSREGLLAKAKTNVMLQKLVYVHFWAFPVA